MVAAALAPATKLKKPKAKPLVPPSVPAAPPVEMLSDRDTETPQPTAPVREVLKFGGMDFVLDYSTALPDEVAAGTRPPDLPFKGWYDKARSTLSPERRQLHIFLPTTFWTQVRKVDPEKATPGYVKGKLRSVFNVWKATGDEAEKKAKAGYELLICGRPDGLPETGEMMPGVSIWLRLKA